MKALVFSSRLRTFSFQQLNGIIAALRALECRNARAIIELYRLLTGKRYSGTEADILANIDNPAALADKILFMLKVVPIQRYEDLDWLNELDLEFIYSA